MTRGRDVDVEVDVEVDVDVDVDPGAQLGSTSGAGTGTSISNSNAAVGPEPILTSISLDHHAHHGHAGEALHVVNPDLYPEPESYVRSNTHADNTTTTPFDATPHAATSTPSSIHIQPDTTTNLTYAGTHNIMNTNTRTIPDTHPYFLSLSRQRSNSSMTSSAGSYYSCNSFADTLPVAPADRDYVGNYGRDEWAEGGHGDVNREGGAAAAGEGGAEEGWDDDLGSVQDEEEEENGRRQTMIIEGYIAEPLVLESDVEAQAQRSRSRKGSSRRMNVRAEESADGDGDGDGDGEQGKTSGKTIGQKEERRAKMKKDRKATKDMEKKRKNTRDSKEKNDLSNTDLVVPATHDETEDRGRSRSRQRRKLKKKRRPETHYEDAVAALGVAEAGPANDDDDGRGQLGDTARERSRSRSKGQSKSATGIRSRSRISLLSSLSLVGKDGETEKEKWRERKVGLDKEEAGEVEAVDHASGVDAASGLDPEEDLDAVLVDRADLRDEPKTSSKTPQSSPSKGVFAQIGAFFTRRRTSRSVSVARAPSHSTSAVMNGVLDSSPKTEEVTSVDPKEKDHTRAASIPVPGSELYTNGHVLHSSEQALSSLDSGKTEEHAERDVTEDGGEIVQPPAHPRAAYAPSALPSTSAPTAVLDFSPPAASMPTVDPLSSTSLPLDSTQPEPTPLRGSAPSFHRSNSHKPPTRPPLSVSHKRSRSFTAHTRSSTSLFRSTTSTSRSSSHTNLHSRSHSSLLNLPLPVSLPSPSLNFSRLFSNSNFDDDDDNYENEEEREAARAYEAERRLIARSVEGTPTPNILLNSYFTSKLLPTSVSPSRPVVHFQM
ncbi:hypothetical protein CPC08DRAFT_217318 [Agrocybe pediades]|nr:hypothetical protein CPC08DRAFT_217318 [Agrocybe pediades]